MANPAHVAKVREMSEAMRAAVPGWSAYEALGEAFKAPVGDARPDAITQGLPEHERIALAAALSLTARKCGKAWRAWRKGVGDRIDLAGADLSGIFLMEIDFSEADLHGTSFRGAALLSCYFNDADLEGASFAGARLESPTFRSGNLSGASLAGARIYGGGFDKANLSRCDFTGATLEGPSADESLDCTDAQFSDCAIKAFYDGSGQKGLAAFRARLSREQRRQLSQGGPCFVATAACGGRDAWEVVALRRYRDTMLLRTAPGRWFAEAYHRASPPLADLIARHPALRAASRAFIVRPLARMAQRATRSGPPADR